MPRSSERDTYRLFTEVFKLHNHNLLMQERQVLLSPFMCVSYASSRRLMQRQCLCLVGCLSFGKSGIQLTYPLYSHTTATIPCIANATTAKGCRLSILRRWQGCAMKRITSNAFAYRHTSERISQHYHNRRANLYLVCITYLCTAASIRRFFCINEAIRQRYASGANTSPTTRYRKRSNACVAETHCSRVQGFYASAAKH